MPNLSEKIKSLNISGIIKKSHDQARRLLMESHMIATQADRMNREFFWKKNNTDKGMSLVAWDQI